MQLDVHFFGYHTLQHTKDCYEKQYPNSKVSCNTLSSSLPFEIQQKLKKYTNPSLVIQKETLTTKGQSCNLCQNMPSYTSLVSIELQDHIVQQNISMNISDANNYQSMYSYLHFFELLPCQKKKKI